jgi:predicted Zn-dependent peptidase
MEYQLHTLANGIRLIHQPHIGNVAHVGIVINTGSRDESAEQHGLAHFIEHVVFKGTKKRKAYHVICRLEDVGGELDAYTTKEETCLYAAFLPQYYERALELIADIVFNSTFPQKELDKEKEVILDEINSYKDSPAELIFDDFEDQLFEGHPLGRNILGEPDRLSQYNRQHLLDFIAQNYHTNQMVICSVGNIPFKKLVYWVEKFFAGQPQSHRYNQRQPLNGYYPKTITVVKDTYQAHCIMGNRAFAYHHPNRLSLELLNNLLGGPGMNSRLNMALRERRGYTYNIESFYTPYTDTGVVGLYFGTDTEKVDKCLHIIKKEIYNLKNQLLGTLQLDRAKKQMIGQMAISIENKSALMLNIGRSLLLFNKVDGLDTVYQKIETLTAKQLLETANEVYDINQWSMLVYK